MRIPIPAQLFERLLHLQTERRWGDDVTRFEDTVCLFPGLGPPLYLTRDGRILAGPCWPDDPPETRSATDDEAVGALVLGCKQYDCPELLAFLPPRPDAAMTCPDCSGTHWFRGQTADGQALEILCPTCGGRGWTPATPSEGGSPRAARRVRRARTASSTGCHSDRASETRRPRTA